MAKIKPLSGTDRVYDWWKKFNEVIDVVNELQGTQITQIDGDVRLRHGFDATNTLIDIINELNAKHGNDS